MRPFAAAPTTSTSGSPAEGVGQHPPDDDRIVDNQDPDLPPGDAGLLTADP